TIPQITFSATASGSFTYFNNFFLDYAGISMKEALQNGWLAVIQPEQYGAASKAWEHCIETLENCYMEFQLKRKSDGMYRWHLFRATAIINQAGEVTSWVGTATDIDEQKSKEQAKDEFISIASHELKTPITTAKAYVQLLEHNLQKDDHADLIFAEKASRSIDKLNHLVGKLLDVSRIQHGQMGYNVNPFDFNKMIRDAVESVQVIDETHSIEVKGSIKKTIKGDEERLNQVMVNLLTNAIKYSPGTDKVVVTLKQEKDMIAVSVKDDGTGISKKNLNKIFNRYFREEGNGSTVKGLGIGLSIAKEIITRHGGKIWAESEPGKGSTFHFTLPI
ncbi:MAG: PAS domain-containing sensor histidine kinase, partial [Ginsengibacter sp.]